MFPGTFWMSGIWIIPVIVIVVMVIMVFVMRPMMPGRSGPRSPWQGVSQVDQKTREGGESDTPLEILKKRKAKGEISKDEFEEMKRDL